jgi:hypothetical protein
LFSIEARKYAQFPMSVQVTSAIQNTQLKYPQWKGLTAFAMRLAAQETRYAIYLNFKNGVKYVF